MSITSLSTFAATSAAGDTKPPATPLQSALAQVATYIPSEVVVTYIAIVGIGQPEVSSTKWACFWLGMALVLVVTGLNAYINRAKADGKVKPYVTNYVLVLVFGLVAFAAYACSIPDSPFLSLTKDATKVGGVAVLVLAAVLPLIGKAADVTPETG